MAGRKPDTPTRREVTTRLNELTRPAYERIKASLTQTDDPRLAWDAAKWVYEMVHGKPTQRQEHSGPDGGPIRAEAAVALDGLDAAALRYIVAHPDEAARLLAAAGAKGERGAIDTANGSEGA